MEGFLKSNENNLMFRLYESASSDDKGYIIDFNIDSANGTLSFESKLYKDQRHTRIRSVGTISEDGSFSTVSSTKFIHTETEEHVSVMHHFDGTDSFYDHHQNDSRVSGYSAIEGLDYNAGFFIEDSHSLTSTPETDPALDLSNFDMSH